MGGMVLFFFCPITVFAVAFVCYTFCRTSTVGQSNRQLNNKRSTGDATYKGPITAATGTEVPNAGRQGQSYPLQPTASAPPLLDANGGEYHPPDQYPQPSALQSTDPTILSEEPPPYPGTAAASTVV